jgi:hypothetical protein
LIAAFVSSDIRTSHRNEGGRQVTEKVIEQGAVSYRFVAEGAPGDADAYEYQGDGEVPESVRDELAAHFDGGEDGDE